MVDRNSFEVETTAADIASAIHRDGYAIVRNVLDAATLNGLQDELQPHIDAAEPSGTAFLGKRTRRVVNLFSRSATCQQIAIHPLVLAIVDRVLLPYCARYQLGYSGVMHLEPGEQAQQLHRDGRCYPFANPSPPLILATMWAVGDFTADNGCTRVVPGSHCWDESRQATEAEVVAAEMPAGSVLLYTSGVLHGGGDNRSTAPRTGVALHYALGWLRQVENQYLALPPEQARALPTKLQRLIGYDYGGPFLGLVNGGDPHQLLEDGPDSAARTTDELETAHGRIQPLRLTNTPPRQKIT